MRIRVRKLQLARRAVQILVVAGILIVPVLARYGNYLSARELDKTLEKWDGTLQGETLGALDALLRALPEGETLRAAERARNRPRVHAYAQGLKGGPWSAQIGPVSLTDPLAAAESLAAGKRSTRVLWIGLIVPVIVALALGRVFCSWVCPMGLLLEMTDKLRRLFRWLELRPHDLRVSRTTKFVLLAIGLALTAAISVPILGYVYPPAVIGRELHELVFGMFDRAEMGRFGLWFGGLTWMSAIVVAIVLIEVTVSRRWWCRYVCPGGALYALLGQRRAVRVRLDTLKCTQCGQCNSACHLGLKPMQNRMGIECDNCAQCVSHCDDDALDLVVSFHGRAS